MRRGRSLPLYKEWKWIRFYNDNEGAYLLYDLANDPNEQTDLVAANP